MTDSTATTTPMSPISDEVAAILASAPIPVDAYRVTPAEDGHPLIVTVVSAWPAPDCMVYGLRPGRWSRRSLVIPVQVLDEGFEPGDFIEMDGWSRPIEEVLLTIPEQVRSAVRPLPACHQSYVLSLVAEVPDFLEMVQRNPVLAGLIAEHHHLTPAPPEELREALRRPRHCLLGLLRLPEARWIVRALAKTAPFALLSPGTKVITQLFTSPDRQVRRRLQHLPTLRADVLSVLNNKDSMRMTSHELLADDASGGFWETADLHGLLTTIRKARADGRTSVKPARFDSRVEVLQAYKAIEPIDLVATYPGEFVTPTGEVELCTRGKPPIKLRPLRSAREMLEHGERQQSCIPSQADYFKHAAVGVGVMYEVGWVDRGDGRKEAAVATLWLRHRRHGVWEVEQLLAAGNLAVPSWVELRVDDWLEQLNAVDSCDIDAPPPAWLIEQEDDEDGVQLVLPFAPWTSLEAPTWV